MAKYPPALISWAISIGCPWTSLVYTFAAHNNLDVIIWLLGYENGGEYKSCRNSLVAIAIANRNWRTLEFLMRDASQNTYITAACAAAELGMINLIQKIMQKCNIYLYKGIECVVRTAIKYNQIPTMEYLISIGVPLDKKAAKFISSIKMVQICRDHNEIIFNKRLYFGAIKANNLEMAKWLWQQECPFNKNKKLLENAALSNSIETTDYLFGDQNRVYWGDTMYNAAMCENYEFIKHIRNYKNICCWDKRSVERIIEHGNLEFIKWMVEDGCRFNPIRSAIKSGNIEVLSYLLLHFKVSEVDVQKSLKRGPQITNMILANYKPENSDIWAL